MRKLFLILVLGLGSSALAAPSQPKGDARKPADSSTAHSFEDLLVQGKYHFSDEAVTTVEEDKVLDSLIGVRTEFKDRLEQSAERF